MLRPWFNKNKRAATCAAPQNYIILQVSLLLCYVFTKSDNNMERIRSIENMANSICNTLVDLD